VTSHIGKDNSLDSSNGVTHGIILILVQGQENKGHHLYCDNYQMLFSSLHTLGFGACGTVQVDRQRMPKCMTAAKLKTVEMKSTEVEKGMLALK